MRSEIRKDYIQDKYVIIAPRRSKRPTEFKRSAPQPRVFEKVCHLCPVHLDQEPYVLEVGAEDAEARTPARRRPGLTLPHPWLIKVVPNKFSAVSIENPKAYGVQEVVVETPKHGVHLEQLPAEHLAKLLWVYAERTKTISDNKKIEYLLIFKNEGGSAGASIHHAHSQIFATHFLPPHLLDKSEKVHAYKIRTGRCVYCDVIAQERGGPRLVFEDEQVIAFTPYASLHNYEVWIFPKRHLDNITLLNAGERLSWAKVLKRALKKITKLNLPYNFYFHQVIHDEDQHLYMKITPRGSIWAGVEIGSGLIINSVLPEEAAKYYRS